MTTTDIPANGGWYSWMYPNIYPDEGPLGRIYLELSHVRAADALIIEYDGERDGWVIRMDRTKHSDDGNIETTERAVEVAFIPAWLE